MARQPNVNAEIQTLITNFTNELELIVRESTLQQVLATLGEQLSVGTPKRGPGRPKGAAKTGFKQSVKRGPGGRRSPDYLIKMSESLLAHVQSNPGQRGEQIAAALKTDVGTMRLPMQKLIAAKKIKTKGNRRGMTYTAV
ncbi:MAG: hypothetical protein JNL28_12135 [Planctomycetes bacterium]|nr:hypothetical protein [Planctomycetota bacterium]